MRFPKTLFLTVGGVGFSPYAPGTLGSLVGLVFYALFISKLLLILNFFAFILFFFLAVHFSDESLDLFGEEDSSRIVIDEFLGIWASLFGLECSFLCLLNAFLLFRFFDIYKPYPVRLVEKKKGGFSVVFDDVLAGVLVNLILRAVF